MQTHTWSTYLKRKVDKHEHLQGKCKWYSTNRRGRERHGNAHDAATPPMPGQTNPDFFLGKQSPFGKQSATDALPRTSTTSLLSPLREHFALVAMQPPNVGMSFQKPTRGIDVRGRIIKSTWWHHGRVETSRNGEYRVVSEHEPHDAVRLDEERYPDAAAAFAVAGRSKTKTSEFHLYRRQEAGAL